MKLTCRSQGITQLETVLKNYFFPFSVKQELPVILRSSLSFICYRKFGQCLEWLKLLEKKGIQLFLSTSIYITLSFFFTVYIDSESGWYNRINDWQLQTSFHYNAKDMCWMTV
jgi:hypothetical protein